MEKVKKFSIIIFAQKIKHKKASKSKKLKEGSITVINIISENIHQFSKHTLSSNNIHS